MLGVGRGFFFDFLRRVEDVDLFFWVSIMFNFNFPILNIAHYPPNLYTHIIIINI